VGQTRLRSQTDIAESVLFVVEFRVLIVQVVSSTSSLSRVLFVLSNLTELVSSAIGHGVENLDNVLGLLLENRILGKVSELVVNALSPVADLIIDNVNALESIAKLREVLHDVS
jgi:hypothetical protein